MEVDNKLEQINQKWYVQLESDEEYTPNESYVEKWSTQSQPQREVG